MILIALGSNLYHPQYGAPRAVCEQALRRLAEMGLHCRRRSRWFTTAPVPPSDQPWFVNGVAEVVPPPGDGPAEILAKLHAVEREFGRVRGRRNEARIIDLDLIDFDGRISDPGEVPQLPHPRLAERAFVLLPLADVVPDWHHPLTGESLSSLLARLPSDQAAKPLPDRSGKD